MAGEIGVKHAPFGGFYYPAITLFVFLTLYMLEFANMLDKALPQQALQYLNQVLGEGAARLESPETAAQLPYFLLDLYDVVPGRLLGDVVTYACFKGKEPLAAHQVGQHMGRFREVLNAPAILVLPTVAPGERKQLIQQGVPFLVPGRQLYAPHMGVILTERFVGMPPQERVLASPATQALLIWFLNHHPLTETWSAFEEAAVLGYTDMTATRAVRELVKFGLFELEVRGRAKYLKRVQSRRELWEMAKPYLRSPVWRTLGTYDHRILTLGAARWAGESALANMSMLNDPQQPVIAMTAEAAQQVKQRGVLFEPRPLADGIAVQVWRYRTDLQAQDINVDPLSLWLSLRDNKDNRVQIALKEIEEKFPW